MFVLPSPNSKVKVLPSTVMVLGGGSGFGRLLVIIMSGISALIKEAERAPLLLQLVRLQGKDKRQRGSRPLTSPDPEFAGTFILDFQACRTEGNKCLLIISHPVYGIFVRVALKD